MNRIGSVSCPRLSGKVSTARLTKGVSVSRNKRIMYLYSVFPGLLLVKNERIRLYLLARGQMTLKAKYMIK
ncbi:MAG: hypothetical protein E7C72_07440 [Dialister sp.]|nr:hypothetical protein [Dialister sp.]